MKRLLLLSIGCSACLITGATTGAKADVSATINAAGKVPSACFVTGTSMPLEMSGPNDLSATGATVMQSSGPAIFALDTVSISGPELAMAGGLSATVLLKSSQGELTASTSSGEKLEVKEFLSDEKTPATVSVASKTGVLPAGIYELKTTLTCVSN